MLQSLFLWEEKTVPILLIKILIALILDEIFGEPKRNHPLSSFGNLAKSVEKRLNPHEDESPSKHQRRNGVLAWALLIIPFTMVAAWLCASGWGLFWNIVLLYLAIGRRSLIEHSQAVYKHLLFHDIDKARAATQKIVSRDCDQLDSNGCAKATVESVLENGNDSIFAVLFWFVLFGGAGAVFYRLANTLDAMWGYKTSRYLDFGWATAKADDLLNYIPARICAFCYSLAGETALAFKAWKAKGHLLPSPNGGPVMSAGGGALNVELGGPASYHGEVVDKPVFGGKRKVTLIHIYYANRLVDRALFTFIALLWIIIWIL